MSRTSAAPPAVPATASRLGRSEITVGNNPYDVAISQPLGQAFAVNDGSVSVVSLSRQPSMLPKAGTPTGVEPTGMAVDTVHGFAYVTTYADDTPTCFMQL